MPDTLQIFHHSPPSHNQIPPHLHQCPVNIESQLNWLIDTDFPVPAIFDGADRFASPEFAGSPFSNFSTSSFDELSAVSNVTSVIEQNQSATKRKFRIDDVVEEDSRKRSAVRDTGSIKSQVKMSSCTNNCNENSRAKMDPKPDYIHVRARRGEATDNHSLAERARREKIKKKMKFLQDIVPGCDKITNKAAMLDEIINYVQFLQRQVEFLTMKLAASTPCLDVKMENLLPKEIFHQQPMSSQWY